MPTEKDYTIIYTENVGSTMRGPYITHYAHIATDDLKTVLQDYGGSVIFVFEGHVKETED